MQRCIRAIAGDEATIQSLRRPLLLTPTLANRPSRRRATTAAAVRKDGPQDALSSHVAKLDKSVSRRLNALVVSKGTDERALKKELEWLKDPVKFADHVHYTLRSNDVGKAINLCRLASKQMPCVVAWNHVINWHVRNQKLNAAIDIYNEMKKRGQFPDSYTYMLLFRAAPMDKADPSKVQGYKSNVAEKAVAIYNSMSSPTSRVKPSIMHTNAVLRLCSLARNMDLLWNVASQIPGSGPGSADHITYSILLSAIRFGAMGPGAGELVYVEQIAGNRNQAVNEGRRIWQEVIPRWRAGEVMIDAALVCSMAKLLNFSKRMEDWDDVLNLVQQTTNIPRLIPPLGSPERNTDHIPQLDDGEDAEEQHSTSEDSEGWVPTPASNAFKPINASTNDEGRPRKGRSLAYVQAENGTLNVLLTACTHMRIPKTAHAYWDLLLKEHDVFPDQKNYECMLRILRLNRSSRKVAELIKHMREEGVKPNPRTYRVAMSACARDKNNTNVVDNMTVIVDEMMRQVQEPDLSTLDEYLNIAKITDDRAALTKALDKAHEIVHRLHEQLQSMDARITPEYHGRVRQFFRHISGLVDTFSQGEEMSKEEVKKWQGRRAEYDRMLTASLNSQGTPKSTLRHVAQGTSGSKSKREGWRERVARTEARSERVRRRRDVS